MKIFEGQNVPVKAWVDNVPLEQEAITQALNIATLPFIYRWIALMPDAHAGKGSTVGSVIATNKAIIPAAVGVDIGCGMMAAKTSLSASDLPENLKQIRQEIESNVPVGFDKYNDKNCPTLSRIGEQLLCEYENIQRSYNGISTKDSPIYQLGTLGGGNHFIEICLDEQQAVWIMLHSGSRGAGNRIGTYFIEKAKEEMRRFFVNLPDQDLAYLPEGSESFKDYVHCVNWAQAYAMENRSVMMNRIISALKKIIGPFQLLESAINCHHNYVQKENHYGKNIFVTRKGAVSARKGQLGIIPGSMGAKSYIVEGLGNEESFQSCSHGAGRVMSRTKAKTLFNVHDLEEATQGVECRKDAAVIDEIPMAYKDIDAVMEAQKELVKPVHILKQVLCIKG